MFLRSIRASHLERTRQLPGDGLIPNPIASLTHAATIRRTPRDVWPWLVQMGAGSRAGWYSWDWLDNGRRPSADKIVPGLQTVAVGALFPAMPGATGGFHVLELEAERFLVLGWRPRADAAPIVTWAFVLEGQPDGHTRLIVRARGAQGYPFYGLPGWIGMPAVRMAHFVMEGKQLTGIARRAESRPPTEGHARTEAA